MTKREKEKLRIKHYWRNCSIKIGVILIIAIPILILTLPHDNNVTASQSSIDSGTTIVGEITEKVSTNTFSSSSYECCDSKKFKNYENNYFFKILDVQQNNFQERMKMKSIFSISKKADSSINTLSYDELVNQVARVIMCEAGGVSNDYWQQLVGYVLLNRVKSSAYPNTISEVLKAGYATETVQKYNSISVTDKALKNAEIVVANYYNNTIPVPENLVYQSEFPQGESWLQIGNTFFGINPSLKK